MAATLKIQALTGLGALALGLASANPAAALVQQSAPASQAEQGERMQLSGGVRLPAAYDPIDVIVPELLAAPSPQSVTQSAELSDQTGFQGETDTGSASALRWYQRFTGAPSEPEILWSGAESFQMEAGDRWGVTLGYSQGERSPQNFDLHDFRAGAFFELTERVRLGGQLRFTSPEEEIFGEESEDRTPEVRFESAFKF